MNDQQLKALVAMALESEELEAPASIAPAPIPIVSGRAGWNRRNAAFGAGAALMAAAVIIAASISSFTGTGPAGNGLAVNPETSPIDFEARETDLAQAPVCPDQTVVLAVYEDAAGDIRCIRWRDHDWSHGRCLREVDPAELLSAGFVPPCLPDLKPHRLMVVALSGPPGQLPDSDPEVQSMAACIAGSHLPDDPSLHQGSCAGVSCIPPEVSVRVETLALSR